MFSLLVHKVDFPLQTSRKHWVATLAPILFLTLEETVMHERCTRCKVVAPITHVGQKNRTVERDIFILDVH